MAKTQIKNYVFKPGIGALNNLFPNAYTLLSENKTFIQKETSAYIADKIANATRYTPSSATYNPATGIMELTIGSHNFNVGDAVNIAANSLTFTCALDGNATTHTYPRSSGVPNDSGTDPFYNKPVTITATSATTITLFVGISSDTSVHTFVSASSNAISDVFYNYTNDSVAKCERDIGYVIDSYLNDLRYGGNEKLRNSIKYYWDQDVAQVDGDRGAEISAHNFIGRLINDYIFTNTEYSALNTSVTQTINESLTFETATYTPTGAVYTPSTGEMTLTIAGHNLTVGSSIVIAPNSLTFTCALDGNATTHTYPRARGVPNTTGRDPFYKTALTISAVTTNTITVNVGISSDTSVHTFVSASPNAISASADDIIDTFVHATVDVIANGLDYMPTIVDTGIGTIKIQGRYSTDELLLITNTTDNVIIYNFSTNATGGEVTLKTDGISEDTDFPKYLQTTDAITTIRLNYDTRNMSSTDDLQIFVEKIENGKSVVTTRPHDFGTDAIERNRVAMAMSMLDADFEYGLQPTKWAAIGTLRGYPSVYEIPGTDTQIISVVTDASAGTSGVGQSLITVTTSTPHGFEAGTPITIKALENAVNGAARAEGSFVITTVPTSTTFTYYAKAKVGTTNGEVLSTGYTQVRKAGFYTGANIGKPTVSVVSNGYAGTLVAELGVPSLSTVLPYDGPSPEIGAPITGNANIPTGAQVTAVRDTSAGGGVYITPTIVGDYPTGTSTITVADATGIITDLAVDQGDGFATYVQGIAGNNITFTDPFVTDIKGNTTTYTAVTGTNITSIGSEVSINVSRAAGSYSITFNDAGTNYEVGDRLFIEGTDLGGLSPTHDLVIIVDSTTSDGSIATYTLSGTAFDGTGTISNLTPTVEGGLGGGASFNVTYTNNVFNSVTISAAGANYRVHDRLRILGNAFTPLGSSPTNDLFITVSSVDGLGGITGISVSGTAPDANVQYTGITTWSTSGSGIDAEFDVTRNGSSYSVIVAAGGTGFAPTDTVTIAGNLLGGATPANDLTITVDNVGGLTEITDISTSGTAVNTDTKNTQTGSNLVGAGFDVDISLSGGSYSATINNAGTLYGANQTFVIPGTSLIGATPTNDLTITITTVDGTGAITGVSLSGTAAGGTGTYNLVEPTNQVPSGTAASFNVVRSSGAYAITVNNAGNNYQIGNRILISGDDLGGASPLNDVILRVTGISGSSIDTFTTTYIEAEPGYNFDLYSTITISEQTSGSISAGSTFDYEALASLNIAFDSAHGLVPGDTFIITVNSDDGINNHTLAAGAFIATDIGDIDQLNYQARAAGTIDTSTIDIDATVYPRPDSFFIHRPFDGGVQLGTGGPQHGAQAIRQSKKYIRYQSGKGIMYTTGALFAPSYDIRSVTADGVEVGSEITIVTDDNDHGLQEGGVIRLLGIETPGYNSGPETATPPVFDYTVTSIIDERTFTVEAQRRLGATTAVLGFGAQMSVISWHGATVRSGIFDDQNGIFWEYDGTQISVVQRTGTFQCTGTIAIDVDSNQVTGTNTRFRDQLKAGDRIIIRGMTHVVSHVDDQTSMTVTPDFRGVTDITGAKMMLIVDKKVKQEEFNLDRLDGTGPSGYDIDIAKMQMIGIQYSWYGAGFIDFMLRGQDGNFIFAHRMRNSNINTEAFMRSGNLPVRYEVTNEGPSGKLASAMTNVQTTVPLVDSSFFPTSGTVYIDNEIITFTGNNKSTNTLTGCTRAATFENFQAGANRSYTAGAATTHEARTGVILISCTITPLISHWGSAFLTDGGFDEDRGYIFSYAETGLTVSTTKQTAFMIRLAPSVSNALVGDLGERELLNRAQLLLQGLEITSEGQISGTPIEGGIVVEGIINPQNYPSDPSFVQWSELSGLAQGGQPSFAQVASGGAITWTTDATSSTANITAQAVMTATAVSNDFNSSNREILWMRYDGATGVGPDGANILVGDTITGPGIQVGTTVQSISSPYPYAGNIEVEVRISRRTTSNQSAGTTYTFARGGNLFNRNFGFFTKASVESAGISSGSTVDPATSSPSFPANTIVNTVDLEYLGATEYYRVTFNNSYSGTLTAGSSTVTIIFEQPPFAQPGETVFSFIAVPGERSTLELVELKELTNTPLGGRGTYPNGPDVLAINIYKVSGADTNANIVLKWGEAQA